MAKLKNKKRRLKRYIKKRKEHGVSASYLIKEAHVLSQDTNKPILIWLNQFQKSKEVFASLLLFYIVKQPIHLVWLF